MNRLRLAAPWMLLVFLSVTIQAEDPAAILEGNKVIVNGYLQALDDPGFNNWERYFTDSSTFNGTRITPEGLSRILANFRLGFPDLEFNVMGQIAEGDRVATWGFFEGTHTGEFQGVAPTGLRARWLGIAVDRIEDGKVAELWHEMDVWGLVQRLQAESKPAIEADGSRITR